MSTQRRATATQTIRTGAVPAPTDRGLQRSRRLKPDVAAKLVERRREERLRELYDRPVSELSEGELLLMRAAFFRSV